MEGDFRVVTSSIVNVTVTTDATSFGKETRFAKDLTISALKGKLELITGSASANMKLSVINKDNETVCNMMDDGALLGSYPIDDGMRIHVSDPTMKAGAFDDLSKVEKQDLSEEDYAKRTDSVRAFKMKNKLGHFADVDPEVAKQKQEEQDRKAAEEKEKADSMNIGDRCEIQAKGQPKKRGTVKFVGEVHFKPGYWVGVKYDEPLGKNDGSVEGKRYFECEPKYGGFVKPANVAVGDFPEEELNVSDDEI